MNKVRLGSIIKNLIGAGGARALNLIITFITVPVIINSVGQSGYALVSVALSLTVMVGFSDLGLGQSIVNYVASAKDKNSNDQAQIVLSTTMGILFALSAVGLTFVTLIFVATSLLNVGDAGFVNFILYSIMFVLLGLPFGVVPQFLFAKEKNYIANFWNTLGRGASLFFIVLISFLSIRDIYVFQFGLLGLPVVVSLISFFWLKKNKIMDGLCLNLEDFRISHVSLCFSSGIKYSLLQIAPFVETGVDVILLGAIVSMDIVPAYDIHLKLFMYIVAFVTMASIPIWPSLLNARLEGDVVWVKSLVKISMISTALLSSLAAACVGFFSSDIVTAWTNQELLLDWSIVLGFAFFSVLSSISVTQSAILNAIGFLSQQARFVFYYIFCAIFLKTICGFLYGEAGLAWALVAMCFIKAVYFFKLIYNSRLVW